jgi:hypothetical protein
MLFQKKKRYSDYIIDLGKLKSKGIIPSTQENPAAASDSSQSSSQLSADGLGFLGALASSASETASSSTDSYAQNQEYSQTYNSSYNSSSDMPIDLRDKIRTISEKLYKILDRLDLIEHKIDRIERKIGIKEDI